MTIIRNNEEITLSMEELRNAYEEYMTSSISSRIMKFAQICRKVILYICLSMEKVPELIVSLKKQMELRL